MSVGNESEFIAPPPGVVPDRTPVPPVEEHTHQPAGLIDIPVGLVDSATYRVPTAPAPKPDRLDSTPAFFPVGMQAPHHPVPPVADAPAPSAEQVPRAANDAVDDATRVFVRPRGGATWLLALADGNKVVVERTMLIGRNPAANPDWPGAGLLSVTDPGKSVSKTHAVLQLTADGKLFAHDLHSTNGVFVLRPGEGSPPGTSEIEVVPGSPVQLELGFTLALGQFNFVIDRAESV